jgi:hypothetical protein
MVVEAPLLFGDQQSRRARGEAYEQRFQGQARCHVFRATGITAYLCPAAPSKTQAMAADESPRTTKLDNRAGDEITLDQDQVD